ncbi:MAG: hypothetical protein J6S85_06195 [Methanobrevibacter sp.]|nr:hypothetical protein [Methanobrevibacter sp.]
MKKYKYKPKIQPKPLSAEQILEAKRKEFEKRGLTESANIVANKNLKTQKTKIKKSYVGLKNQVQRAINDVNARLRRLEREGLTSSQAYRTMKEKYGEHPTLSLDVRTKQGLENKLKELRAFQKMKSSTLKGERTIQKNREKYMLERGIDFGGDKEKAKVFYDLLETFMERVQKNNRKNKKNYDSHQVEQVMYKMFMERGATQPSDINKFFANIRSYIAYWENKANEKESGTFESLTDKPKKEKQTRTRSSRSR